MTKPVARAYENDTSVKMTSTASSRLKTQQSRASRARSCHNFHGLYISRAWRNAANYASDRRVAWFWRITAGGAETAGMRPPAQHSQDRQHDCLL